MNIEILDVFASEKYAGNQLAVVHGMCLPHESEFQKIAAEINFSETVFVTSAQGTRPEEPFDIRIFTPREEIPFAGHPIIGTAHVIGRCMLHRMPEALTLRPPAGPVRVNITEHDGTGPLFTMIQPAASFISRDFMSSMMLSEVLGISDDDINPDYPTVEASTGLPVLLVPIRSIQALARIRIDPQSYDNLMGATSAKGIYAFHLIDDKDGVLNIRCRMFAPGLGISEDPATGSAAGALAACMLKHAHGVDNITGLIHQGVEMGRPGVIHMHATQTESGIVPKVGGHVRHIMSGRLL